MDYLLERIYIRYDNNDDYTLQVNDTHVSDFCGCV